MDLTEAVPDAWHRAKYGDTKAELDETKTKSPIKKLSIKLIAFRFISYVSFIHWAMLICSHHENCTFRFCSLLVSIWYFQIEIKNIGYDNSDIYFIQKINQCLQSTHKTFLRIENVNDFLRFSTALLGISIILIWMALSKWLCTNYL